MASDDFDFDDYIGVEIVSTAKDRVVGRLLARRQHLIDGERIHGGLVVALAATLVGHGSALNLDPDCETTTIELKINFMHAGQPGPIFGVAIPLHLGKSTMVWQISIHDERDRRLAVVQQTQIVLRADQRQRAEPATDGGARDRPSAVKNNRSTSEQRRAQIVAATFSLISKQGFAQTSVREIAEAVGVSVPAIYKYVSNKDEILELIFQDYMQQSETQIANAAYTVEGASEKLRLAISAGMAEIAKHHAQIRMAYRESRLLQPEVRDRIKMQGLNYINIYRAILDEGVASGVFREMDTKLVASLIPMLCEVWTLRRWAVVPLEPEEICRGIIDLVLNGISTVDLE